MPSWRFLRSHPGLRDALQLAVFQRLCWDAEYEDRNRQTSRGSIITVRRGQALVAERALAAEIRLSGKPVSKDQIRRALRGLEKAGLIKRLVSPLGTLVTICDYERFHDRKAAGATAGATARATAGATDSNKTKNLESDLKTEVAHARAGVPGSTGSPWPSKAEMARDRFERRRAKMLRELEPMIAQEAQEKAKQAGQPQPRQGQSLPGLPETTDQRPTRPPPPGVEAWVLPPPLIRGRPAAPRLASPHQSQLALDGGTGPVPFWRRSPNYERLSQERVEQLAAERVEKIGETYDARTAVEVAMQFPALMPRPKLALKRFPRRPARYVCRCREGRGRAARSRTIYLGEVSTVSLSEACARFWRVVLELANTGKVTGRWREPSVQGAVGSRTNQGSGDGAAG